MMIQYINPLSRAFERMKAILFRPFNLEKWFALGFTAFLAHLMDSYGGKGGGGYNHNTGNIGWDGLFDLPGKVMGWFSAHPFWTVIIAIGVAMVIVLCILFTWLSSRGMFMFLDNVVNNRSLVKKPWSDFKTSGDSVFLWRVAFMIISSIIIIGFVIAGFLFARILFSGGRGLVFNIIPILGMALIGLALFLAVFFISIFLHDFVVPIMYKTGAGVNEGWGRFLALFNKDPWHFILYGLFVICLFIGVGVGIIIAGVMTCCCGFIILIIPYISSVLLLPVSVTFRAFSLEFLEQYGDEYRIFPVVPVDEGTTKTCQAPGDTMDLGSLPEV